MKGNGPWPFTSTHEDSYFGNLLQNAVRTVIGPDAPLQMHGLLGTEEKIRDRLASANFSGVRISSEFRGGYKSVGSIQCTRGFLSVFFKGDRSVVDLNDEQFARVRDLFLKSIAEVETQEGVW